MNIEMENLFPDILGHESVKNGLLHAIKTGRLHHALLLSGPSGIGKAMLARAMIQTLWCVHSSIETPARCQNCPQCNRVKNNAHPDLIEIQTDTATLKIDAIRELQRKLAFPPYESQRRFVIIHDIHKMQDAAANCLLKTLEEPEPHTTFFLITSQIQRLLPTITSRCQLIRFAPFEHQTVVQFLRQQGQSQEMARQIAALADGSLGAALELANEDYQRELLDTFEGILNTQSTLHAFSIAATLKGKKNLSEHLLALLLTYIRDLIVMKTAPNEPIVLEHYRERMTQRLPHTTCQSLQRAATLIQDIQDAFLGNVNELLAWERLVIGMHGVLYNT